MRVMRVATIVIVFLGTRFALAEEARRPLSARQTMQRMVEALERKDMADAREMAVSADEYAAFSKRPVDREKYAKRLDGFFTMLSRELSQGVELAEAEAADALILPAGQKTRHRIIMVVIYARFRNEGKVLGDSPMPFFFIEHEGKWKFFMRK